MFFHHIRGKHKKSPAPKERDPFNPKPQMRRIGILFLFAECEV